MKIKLTYTLGSNLAGSSHEAVINYVTKQAFFFDLTGAGWYVPQGEYEIDATELNPTTLQGSIISISKLFGQEIKSLEFK